VEKEAWAWMYLDCWALRIVWVMTMAVCLREVMRFVWQVEKLVKYIRTAHAIRTAMSITKGYIRILNLKYVQTVIH
jgi:hypothetical protein